MEGGFTVIEVLVSALILGIGILGLTLLLVMTVRSATGARALNTGVLVAESLLDRIELEGRLSWLNLTNNGSNAIQPLSTLQYVNQTKLSTPLLFNAKGAPPNSTTTDPADQIAFYTVNLVQTPISTLTSIPGAGSNQPNATLNLQTFLGQGANQHSTIRTWRTIH